MRLYEKDKSERNPRKAFLFHLTILKTKPNVLITDLTNYDKHVKRYL